VQLKAVNKVGSVPELQDMQVGARHIVSILFRYQLWIERYYLRGWSLWETE
jgi:hypothetical protein